MLVAGRRHGHQHLRRLVGRVGDVVRDTGRDEQVRAGCCADRFISHSPFALALDDVEAMNAEKPQSFCIVVYGRVLPLTLCAALATLEGDWERSARYEGAARFQFVQLGWPLDDPADRAYLESFSSRTRAAGRCRLRASARSRTLVASARDAPPSATVLESGTMNVPCRKKRGRKATQSHGATHRDHVLRDK